MNEKNINNDFFVEIEEGKFYIDFYSMALLNAMQKKYGDVDLRLLENAALVKKDIIGEKNNVKIIEIDSYGEKLIFSKKVNLKSVLDSIKNPLIIKENVFDAYKKNKIRKKR